MDLLPPRRGTVSIVNNYPAMLTLAIGDKTHTIPGNIGDFYTALAPGLYNWTASILGIAAEARPSDTRSGWNTLLAFGGRSNVQPVRV